jgi:hypothetical protein
MAAVETKPAVTSGYGALGGIRVGAACGRRAQPGACPGRRPPPVRHQGAEGLDGLARAQATGHLRADFTPEDLVLVLMANAGVIAATGDAAPDSWRRLVGHLLHAFATPGAPTRPCRNHPASLVCVVN